MLEAAGDLLRRSTSFQVDVVTIDRVLMLVPNGGLTSWGEAVSVEDLAKRVARAAEEAVEAALPDTPEDGSTWQSWAMQGLFARDRLESALAALERLDQNGRKDAGALRARLQRAVDAADQRLKHRARWLSALNPERRAEAALLDHRCRARAWWFSERCAEGDDGLVRALGEGGEGLTGPEAAAHREVTQRRSRKVGFDELFRYDLGLASPAEQALIEAQAKKDPELRKAIAAMRDAEAAIEESGDRPPTPVGAGPAPADGERGSVEVIAERTEFKVLVFRRQSRVRLVVQPKRTDRFAAAAVFLPPAAPNTARPSRDTAEGLVDLGPEKLLLGQVARVVVRLQGGGEVRVEARL